MIFRKLPPPFAHLAAFVLAPLFGALAGSAAMGAAAPVPGVWFSLGLTSFVALVALVLTALLGVPTTLWLRRQRRSLWGGLLLVALLAAGTLLFLSRCMLSTRGCGWPEPAFATLAFTTAAFTACSLALLLDRLPTVRDEDAKGGTP